MPSIPDSQKVAEPGPDTNGSANTTRELGVINGNTRQSVASCQMMPWSKLGTRDVWAPSNPCVAMELVTLGESANTYNMRSASVSDWLPKNEVPPPRRAAISKLEYTVKSGETRKTRADKSP